MKPQLAFFEALGSDGWLALETASRYASEAGLLVIADGKRGDIGSTARAYSAAFLEPRGTDPPLADALTVNPFLGSDSMDPFLSACRNHGAGLFVPRAHVQRRRPRHPGRGPLGRHAGLAPRRRPRAPSGGRTSSGSEGCRASAPSSVPRCRGSSAMPGGRCRRRSSCCPGVGAQGATPADVARAFTSGPASALVNASRSVIYAYRDADDDWRAAAGAEAARLAAEVWAASGW